MSDERQGKNMETDFIIEHINSMRKELAAEIKSVSADVSKLTAIVTNGLSDRTTKTERAVDEIKLQMVTQSEFDKLVQDRSTADDAWKKAREKHRQLVLSMIVGPLAGGVITALLGTLFRMFFSA